MSECIAEASITVAPESRRRGFACGRSSESAEASGITTLIADIHPDNVASIKAFSRAGYYSFVHPAGLETNVRCERRIAKYTP